MEINIALSYNIYFFSYKMFQSVSYKTNTTHQIHSVNNTNPKMTINLKNKGIRLLNVRVNTLSYCMFTSPSKTLDQ